MEVFVEPFQKNEEIILSESPPFKLIAEELALLCGIHIHWQSGEKKISSVSELLIEIANHLAWQRERSAESLKNLNDFSSHFKSIDLTYFRKSISILGSGLMVEALAHHFSILEWTVRAISADENKNADFEAGECFIFTKEALKEKDILNNIFDQKPAYIGLIDDFKNAKKSIDSLGMPLSKLQEFPLFIPAGLDIGAKNPYETSLSIAAEILKELRLAQ